MAPEPQVVDLGPTSKVYEGKKGSPPECVEMTLCKEKALHLQLFFINARV